MRREKKRREMKGRIRREEYNEIGKNRREEERREKKSTEELEDYARREEFKSLKRKKRKEKQREE